MPVYLDCNATTPVEPRVAELVMTYLTEEFGNAGSRTHDFGARAKKAVQKARDQIAAVVGAKRDEVLFTSGATESNNIAILGLAEHGEKVGKKHLVTTQIEHKAVLEPFEELERRGFEVDYLVPNEGGWIEPEALREALRGDTLLVSIMHVNNETGIVQPLDDYTRVLEGYEAWLHVDAAQGFGKCIEDLRNARLDLISVSSHKVYGPKGVGALVARRRGFQRPPLAPLMFGGGQERGVRPGTLPVHLIVGLGLAAEIALKEHQERQEACAAFRQRLLDALMPLEPRVNGDQERCVPHAINLAFEGIDSEALMVALKGLVAISNGSACTSQSYTPSHVLQAMRLPEWVVDGAVRISWCHMTPEVDWDEVGAAIRRLL